MEYYNETSNDRWILEDIFPGKRNGYFVEAGAANGKGASSCYLLETKLGWTGICVEPNDFFYKGLVKNRPNSHCENVCLSDVPGTVVFVGSDRENEALPYLSGIKGNLEEYKSGTEEILRLGTEVEKPAVTLVSLLEKHRAPNIIDYGAFDIEGSELVVLRDFPFDRYRFLALSLECDEAIWQVLFPILERYGYREVKNSFNTNMPWEKYCLHASLNR